MLYTNNRLMRSPGDDDKNNPAALPDDSTKKEIAEKDDELISEETPEEPLAEKVKDALQDWSNKDQADQDFDDTRV